MRIELVLIAIPFVLIMTYVIYQLINESKNITKEKILKSTKYVEDKLEELFKVNETKALSNYNNILKESVLRKLHINISIFLILDVAWSIFIYKKAQVFFNQAIAGMIVAFIGFMIPFTLVEIERSFKSKRVREHLPNFLLMFLQTLGAVSGGDSVHALNIIKNSIKDPIKGPIKQFIKNYNKGIPPKDCITKLKSTTDNVVFGNFCNTIESNIMYGVSINGSVEELVKASYAHQINYMERISENMGNLVSMLMILILFVLTFNKMQMIDTDMMDILRNSAQGKLAINVVLGTFVISFKLAKTSITYKDN